MKVISVIQPWASLIAIGAKRFETRSWTTKHRGSIAIHASKKEVIASLRTLPADIQKQMFDCFYEKFGINSGAIKNMPTGCIVAIADLVECFSIGEDYQSGMPALYGGTTGDATKNVGLKESKFGDYTIGRFAWELTNVRQIEPIPAKGQLGLWNWEGIL